MLYNSNVDISYMRKNLDELKTTIEINPATGEYYTVIPEWVINDQGWYEGTSLQFDVDADEILITERDD